MKAPGFFLDPMIRKAYCGAQWNGPAQGMVDPVKEVSAAEKRIAIGLSTRQKETVEMNGGDFEDNVVQLAHEAEMMKAAGLTQAETKTIEKESNDNEDDDNKDEDPKRGAGGGADEE